MARTILITGCSTGIGRALALEFARQGARVIATARRPESIADLASNLIRTEKLDVLDEAGIAALAEKLETEGVVVDMVVNNAGYGAFGPIVEVHSEDLRAQFETNVIGLMAVTREFAKRMMARRSGTIVNVASIVGLFVTPFGGPYSASKFAVNALTDALRMELKPFGVRVVNVQPGAVKSNFGANADAGVQTRLKPDTAYAAYRAGIEARAVRGQKNAMPTEDFARGVVAKLLSDNPPAIIRRGTLSAMGPFMAKWFPLPLRDWILSREFGIGK